MTTKDKALAIANTLFDPIYRETLGQLSHEELMVTLVHAIEQHEATKREFSDTVEKAQTVREIHCQCSRKHVVSFDILNQFIIPAPKPDPLVEVLAEVAADYLNDVSNEKYTNAIRAALEARGLEIREKNNV